MKLFGKEKPQKKKDTPVDEAPQASSSAKKKKAAVSSALKTRGTGRTIVQSPLLTEKASRLETQENSYVFLVHSRANKSEIQKEIERLFDVRVQSVRIINQPRKRYVWRGHVGFSAGSKKAIVTIAEGKKIEILPT